MRTQQPNAILLHVFIQLSLAIVDNQLIEMYGFISGLFCFIG